MRGRSWIGRLVDWGFGDGAARMLREFAKTSCEVQVVSELWDLKQASSDGPEFGSP